MTHQAIDFVLLYFVFPYSLMAYIGFSFFILRDLIKDWLKERKEKNAAKNKPGDGK